MPWLVPTWGWGEGVKGLSRNTWATKAHPVGDNPSFRNMKQLRLLLLPSVPTPPSSLDGMLIHHWATSNSIAALPINTSEQ